MGFSGLVFTYGNCSVIGTKKAPENPGRSKCLVRTGTTFGQNDQPRYVKCPLVSLYG